MCRAAFVVPGLPCCSSLIARAVGATRISTLRRSASRITSGSTGSFPSTPVPMTRRLQFQGCLLPPTMECTHNRRETSVMDFCRVCGPHRYRSPHSSHRLCRRSEQSQRKSHQSSSHPPAVATGVTYEHCLLHHAPSFRSSSIAAAMRPVFQGSSRCEVVR